MTPSFRTAVRNTLPGIVLLGLTVSAAVAQKPNNANLAPPEFSKLRSFYDYDAKKDVLFKTEDKSNDQAFVLHIEFNGPSGDKVTGLFAKPKAEGVYPCVLLLHGLTSNKETMAVGFGPSLVKQNIAVLALDAPMHGERKKPDDNPSKPENFPGVLHDGCREYRVALDWLAKRKDIDSAHIGLLGYSMGSFMGSILGALDTRIKAFALCVGGDPILPLIVTIPEDNRDVAYSISTSLFIGRIAPRPILMLNGKQDTVVKEEASKRLYSAAKEPKEQVWYESGHILPKEALEKSVSWLTAKLKHLK